MERLFSFLRSPFSFQGRYSQIQYVISLLITGVAIPISIGLSVLSSELFVSSADLEESQKELDNLFLDIEDMSEDEFSERYEYLQSMNDYYSDDFYETRENTSIAVFSLLIILPAIFLFASGTKRSHDIGDSGLLQIAFPLYIFVLLLKKSEEKDNQYGPYSKPIRADKKNENKPIEQNSTADNVSVIIPEICPHCKSPNAKRIRICEWCGSQII
jgi:uncharacterized membrane protein YhaH (DUF805 family)